VVDTGSGSREFRVSAPELELLRKAASRDEGLLRLLAHPRSTAGGGQILSLDRSEAERLRDCLTTHLAVTGFHKDYSLTDSGRMLEELIDRFYTP